MKHKKVIEIPPYYIDTLGGGTQKSGKLPLLPFPKNPTFLREAPPSIPPILWTCMVYSYPKAAQKFVLRGGSPKS
jgi:hypothetical protein